jgi:hypothetical protein
MDTFNKARKVYDRASFVNFVQQLADEVRSHPENFENLTAHEVLESLAAWVEDSDGFYANVGESPPEISNWRAIADMLAASLVYEA